MTILDRLLGRQEKCSDDPLALARRFGPPPRGIVHIGANDGEEFAAYAASGASCVVYVEPLPEPYARLIRKVGSRPGHVPVQALIAEQDGRDVEFNVASNRGQSSSLFSLGRHARLYPEIGFVDRLALRTVTLDSLLGEPRFSGQVFDLLVVDVQGAELLVLKGAERTLQNFRYLSLEVSETPLYEASCTLDDIVTYLEPRGFRLRHLDLNEMLWGHAFFVHVT